MEEEIKLTVRLPVTVHAALVRQARLDQRSLNGEIVFLLRQTVAEPPAVES